MLATISSAIDLLTALHYGLSILSMLSESVQIKYSRRFRSFRIHVCDIRMHLDADGYQIWTVGAPAIEFAFSAKAVLSSVATAYTHIMIDSLGAAVQSAAMSLHSAQWEALEREIESSFLLPVASSKPLRYIPCGQRISRPSLPSLSGFTA